jgi:hypothetical protein
MKTRIADLIVKTAAEAALAAVLAFGSVGAQQDDSGNYFDSQAVPAGAQTEVDPNDPYAPVDLGTSGASSLRLGGVNLSGSLADDDVEDPCSPQRCKAW